ncbi:MAG: nucleotidyltransferase [Bacteroidota bacterium]
MLDKVLKVIDSFNKHDVQYVIIGGYAVILHGFLRATDDIDILLEMSLANISNFQKALLNVYNDPEIDEISFKELQTYSVIRYGTPDNFYIDVISRIGEMFSYQNIDKVSKVIDGVEIKFASAEALFMLKKNTYREKDKLDILFLIEKLKND